MLIPACEVVFDFITLRLVVVSLMSFLPLSVLTSDLLLSGLVVVSILSFSPEYVLISICELLMDSLAFGFAVVPLPSFFHSSVLISD